MIIICSFLVVIHKATCSKEMSHQY